MATSELMALRNDLTTALQRVDRLLNQPDPGASADGVDILSLPRTVAIETVLNRSGKAMRPVEIWAALQATGRTNDPKSEVQVTTYDLAKAGRIERVGWGQYKALA